MSSLMNSKFLNTQLPQEPFSVSWKATIGDENEADLEIPNTRPDEFYAIQVGYFSSPSNVVVACVYNGEGVDEEGVFIINPVYFYTPGQIVNIRGRRIASSGRDRTGTSFTTTSNITFLLRAGVR